MLARKAQLQSKGSLMSVTQERSRLNQARTLAVRRQDFDEVATIDQQLAALIPAGAVEKRPDPTKDALAQVNERNRRANLETVRRAEQAAQELKRKLLMSKRAAGTATPTTPLSKTGAADSRFVRFSASSPLGTATSCACVLGFDTGVDRIRSLNACSGLFVLNTRASATFLESRPQTPSTLQVPGATPADRPISPSGTPTDPTKIKNFEASLVASIEIDLGDF